MITILDKKGAQQWALVVLASVFLMGGVDSMASQTQRGVSEGPPSSYQIDDVSISFTRHAGAKTGSIAKRINISGTGISTIEHDGKELLFTYSSEDLLALLNSFYKIRFFNLPSIHNVKYSVFLDENGSIGTSILRMNDALSTTVCFSIPDYKKCVTYSLNGPHELDQLAQRIFAEADRLSNSNKTQG